MSFMGHGFAHDSLEDGITHIVVNTVEENNTTDVYLQVIRKKNFT